MGGWVKKRLMVASLINAHTHSWQTQLASAALCVRSPSEIKAVAKWFRTRPRVGRTRLPHIFALLSLFGRDKQKKIKNHNSSSPRSLLLLLLALVLRSAFGTPCRISRLGVITCVSASMCVCVCVRLRSQLESERGVGGKTLVNPG